MYLSYMIYITYLSQIAPSIHCLLTYTPPQALFLIPFQDSSPRAPPKSSLPSKSIHCILPIISSPFTKGLPACAASQRF